MRVPKTLSSGERKFWNIKKEIERNNSSLEEEYEKVVNKTSNLTKSEREYLTLIIHTKEELVRIKNKDL